MTIKLKFFSLFVFIAIITPVLSEENKCGIEDQNSIRPCPENNKACVRNYFQSRRHCKEDVAASDTLHKRKLKGYLPYFNLTSYQYNVTIGGISSGKIVDFLVDHKNDLIVLAVNFMNLTLEAPVDFVYYVPAKLPRRLSSVTNELYESVTITTIFYGAEKPKRKRMFSMADITGRSVHTMGPCVTENKDPEWTKVFKTFTDNVRLAAQEAFLTRSNDIALDYIRKNLCNFCGRS